MAIWKKESFPRRSIAVRMEQYGPVSLRDLESSDVYDWLNAPWPWQQEGEGK